jgi:phospholipid/cholesterol/gamma-HCH transport system substrate-binding protein
MEPEAKYTIVGTVVLVLLGMLAAAVLWLHGSGAGPAAQPYRILFQHESLEGLAPRGEVTMRGIRVGTVTGYRFSPQQPGAVEVFIAVAPGIPVLQSTRATVGRNLLTGLAAVRLVNTSENSRPLAAGTPGQAPLIPEGQSQEDQLQATLAGLVQRMNSTLSPENQARFAQSLANVARLSGHADRTLGKLDTALDAMTRATRNVGALAASVQADAGALTARYDELGLQATRTVRDAGEQVKRAGADVERLSRRADALAASSDRELQATGASLRAAAQSMAIAADRLREPGEVLTGPPPAQLGPGERPQ